MRSAVIIGILLGITFAFMLIIKQSDARLDRLERTMWGESQAPATVDPTAEITGYDYDCVETWVALYPSLAPLVEGLFKDGVIVEAEYDQGRAAIDELEDRDRVERSVADAKADLRKGLEAVRKRKEEGNG